MDNYLIGLNKRFMTVLNVCRTELHVTILEAGITWPQGFPIQQKLLVISDP